MRDRKGTPKNVCDKDFAELSGELSGVICLKALVLLGSALELFRKFLVSCSFLALNLRRAIDGCTKKHGRPRPEVCFPAAREAS